MTQERDPYDQLEFDDELPTSDEPPGPLFHYTNARGLMGIVEKRQVWATHCRHLNDMREMQAGSTLVRDALRSLHTEARQLRAGDLLRALERRLDATPIHTFYAPFLASFSQDGDLLSQWRAYGDDGAGYSLGLDLASVLATRTGITVRLVKCEYDADAFQRRARDGFVAIAQKMDAYREAGFTDEARLLKRAHRAFMLHASVLVPRFKSPGFREEREWRLVAFTADEKDEVKLAKFREGRRGLIPYFEIGLDHGDNRMPLTSVIVGPMSDPLAGAEAAALLLLQHGYPASIVTRSDIPYRSSR